MTISPSLAKAQNLAKENRQLAYLLDPENKKLPHKKKRNKKLLEQTKQIQDFYNEPLPPTSVVMLKPDDNKPLSIPLSRQKDLLKEKSYKEIKKMALSDLKNAILSENEQNTQQTGNDKKTSDNNTSMNTSDIVEDVSNSTDETIMNMEGIKKDGKVLLTPIGDKELPSKPVVSLPQSPKKRGRPRKSEKVSQATSDIDAEKVSQDLDDIVNLLPLQVKAGSNPVGVGKTSLTYLSIYSNSLTPQMLEKILSINENSLPLTIAEIMALKLMKKSLNNDIKSEKMYWDLQKTLEKNKKPQQIKKTESTLLEQKLAEAKSAILIEKPVDSPESE